MPTFQVTGEFKNKQFQPSIEIVVKEGGNIVSEFIQIFESWTEAEQFWNDIEATLKERLDLNNYPTIKNKTIITT